MLSLVDRELAYEAESVSYARHSLDEFEEKLPSRQLKNLCLLVSELMTNAVQHAVPGSDSDASDSDASDSEVPESGISASSIRFRVLSSAELVRVEVHDGGPGFELGASEVPPPEQVDGRGLYLVGLLSDRWGVEPVDQLVCVWFEIHRDLSLESGAEPAAARL